MLMMPVDLFGAYMRGQEYAIDRNWNDMNQAARLESQWLTNDQKQLQNWKGQDTYANEIARDNAATAMVDMSLGIQQAGYPGMVNSAKNASDLAGIDRQNFLDNQPAIAGARNEYLLGNVGTMRATGKQAQARATNDVNLLPQYTTTDFTTKKGAYEAGNITGAAQPIIAKQGVANTIAEGANKGTALTNAATNAPLVNTVNELQARTAVYQNYIQSGYTEVQARAAAGLPPVDTGTIMTPSGVHTTADPFADMRQGAIAKYQNQLQQLRAQGLQGSIPYIQAQRNLAALMAGQ